MDSSRHRDVVTVRTGFQLPLTVGEMTSVARPVYRAMRRREWHGARGLTRSRGAADVGHVDAPGIQIDRHQSELTPTIQVRSK
jgi:hypothetical protein